MSEKRRGPGILGRVGRGALASAFITSGIDVAREPGARAEKVAGFGIPQAELATRLNGAGMAVAGTALALGIRPRQSALVLLALLVPTTIIGHAFWTLEGPARRAQEVQVFKNLAMAGGLLEVIRSER